MHVHVHTQDSEVIQKIAGFNKMAIVIRCCRAQSKKHADQQLVYGSFYVAFSPFSHACSSQSTLTPPFFFLLVSSQISNRPLITFSSLVPILLHPCPYLEFLNLT